jgi:microcystin-dependent protein
MSNPFLGQVIIFAGNFAPKGWAFCNGQLLAISQYTALFSLLGTTYGGDGRTTFGLPDLRGRVAVSAGQGPGLSNYTLGEQTGTETVTLSTQQMPQHNHIVNANNNTSGAVASPSQAFLSGQSVYTQSQRRAVRGQLAGPSQHPADAGDQLHHRVAGHLPLPRLIR